MKINLIFGLVLIGLLIIALPGSSDITIDMGVVFSSSSDETSNSEQQDDDDANDANDNGSSGDDANDNGSSGDDANDNGSSGDDANEDSGPELRDTINPSLTDETLSEEEQQEQQEQQELTMEIIKSNGLVPINDTSSSNTNADGVGNGGNNPAAREVTCVKNDRGQVFCYEVLEPDENCLKPIKEEDPPLCGSGNP